MPSLIIPDTRTMYIYPQSQQSTDYDTYKTLQGCIWNHDIVDAPDGDNTISRGDYLKKYLFDNKYDDIITFDKVVCSDNQNYWSCGMYIRVASIPSMRVMGAYETSSIEHLRNAG